MQNATMNYIVHKGIYWENDLSFFAKINLHTCIVYIQSL